MARGGPLRGGDSEENGVFTADALASWASEAASEQRGKSTHRCVGKVMLAREA